MYFRTKILASFMRNKIILLIFLLSSAFFDGCTTTAWRAFVRRDASVKDYLYFPDREIAASENPKPFTREIDARTMESTKSR